MLSCPVCSSPLETKGTQLVCQSNHSFDRARQGYYNLLLNQHKKSRQPGDNAAMVQARTEFLNRGYYQSISDTLNQFAVEQLWQTPGANIVDLGCGEGYYTHRLCDAMQDHQIDGQIYGLDISKDAIKAAAKRSKRVHWLVANGSKPPFEQEKAHLVMNIFNRIMPESLKHICHPQGRVLIVSAGPYHLRQLKEALYESPRFDEFDCRSALAEHFEHQHRTQLDFEMRLDQSGIANLLHMTPHTWRSSPATQSGLLAQTQLDLRVQVNLDWFKPCSSSAGSVN